jgi:2-oxoisovalerate dehydrogenase E1 component
LRLQSEDADLMALGSSRASRILFHAYLIRRFEGEVLRLSDEGCVWGPVHSSIGQEAVAAAAVAALSPSDLITGSHRAHHQVLVKTIEATAGSSWDPTVEDIPAEAEESVFRLMAEILGLAPGYCGGRGGSMHLCAPPAGVMGTNAIVGGGIPIATGLAYAQKHTNRDVVTLCFFGDGAANQGTFHEALNLAGIWRLPIVYVIENNQYAVGTRCRDASAVGDLALRGASYAMPSFQIEGHDVAGVHEAVRSRVEECRRGAGPTLIEVRCYRRYHHKGSLPGSAYKYRSAEEEAAWEARDALQTFPAALERLGLLTAGDSERLAHLAERAVRRAVERCMEPGPGGKPRIREVLWPPAESVALHCRSKGEELQKLPFREREDFAEFEALAYSDAIAAVTERWLAASPEVLLFGEEVANFGGGAYGATRGLPARYPRQIVNTPISEAGFVGLACGTALCGLPTIVELMYPDFALVAADQLLNQIGKLRHMYGGAVAHPIVVRTRVATGTGFGGQHSMDLSGLFSLFSGWRVAAPSDAFDYVGLFNTAMHSRDPVLILEHHSLYRTVSSVPAGTLGYCIPFGRARVIASGSDVSVLCYSSMVGRMLGLRSQLEAAGVSTEIVDLRCLDTASLDLETVGRSVAKTGTVVIVEEAAAGQGIGEKLAATITARHFDCLDGPPCCLASLDVPPPVSKVLEQAALLQDTEVLQTVEAVARRRWK